MAITHAFTATGSETAGAAAAGKVVTSHWNEDHTIADGTITLAQMANLATAKIIGRTTAGTGVPEALSISGTGSVAMTTSPTLTKPVLTGNIETKTAPTISTGTLTLDCSAGNVFVVALDANITTLAFSNVPATGNSYSLTLVLTADGTPRTVTWGASVAKWPGGTAPTLTSTNAKSDFFVLTTWDGGTTWYPTIAGQNR